MAYQLIWSPTARLDLSDLFKYISESDPESAKRFVRGVFQTVERLIEFPESGRVVPEFNEPRIREVIRRPCRIVYRLRPDKHLVEIVRVWHAARGIPNV